MTMVAVPGWEVMMAEGLRGREALGAVAPPTAPSEVDPTALGARVAAARARAALTGAQLGARLGLGKDQISRIENGKRRVNVRELPLLAEALGVSIGHLLGRRSRPRLAMANRLVTGEAGIQAGGPATRQRALQLLEVEDLLSRVAEAAPIAVSPEGAQVRAYATTRFAARPRNRAEAQRQGLAVAQEVRRQLNLGGSEIGDLAGLIERHFGVDVALSPLGTESDGLCLHGEDVALIVVSSDFSEGHVRFTLAHELGHHVFDDPRDVIDEGEREMFADDLIEKRVNAFAGHLLMPEQGLREMVQWAGSGVLNERTLVAIMQRFGVSLAALIQQLTILGYLTAEQGARLRERTVSQLVARHPDVAPSGAGTTVRSTVRAPERLLRGAIDAARAEQIGLSVVAVLLERRDDDELWQQIMEDDDLDGGSAGTVPVR
jgi:Zn-dependent peptidase ImmA (M78 family)/transcriptional regulator with XRE-family HTH domain